MRLSRILFLVALAANAITLYSYYWVTTQPSSSGAGMIYVLFIFPGIWIAFFILAVALTITLRNKNGPDSSTLRVIAFVFCTPIPVLSVAFGKYLLEEQGPSLFTTSVETRNHKFYKSEVWTGRDDAAYVQMYFKADSVELISTGDGAYKKDSAWIYLDKRNDTLKIEFYRDDILLKTIEKKK